MVSPAEVADFKSKSSCKACNRFGHRPSEQQADGSLPASVPCTDRASSEKHYAQYEPEAIDQQKKTLLFNMVVLESGNVSFLSASSSHA